MIRLRERCIDFSMAPASLRSAFTVVALALVSMPRVGYAQPEPDLGISYSYPWWPDLGGHPVPGDPFPDPPAPDADPGQPQFVNATGAEYATKVLEDAVDGIDVLDVLDIEFSYLDPTSIVDLIDPASDLTIHLAPARDEGAAAGASFGQGVGGLPAPGSTPTSTGGPRVVTADGGTAEANAMDPVDPMTGELVIEETDLELPSSGIPFRFVTHVPLPYELHGSSRTCVGSLV
jgi:hypothetical protein